VTALIAQIWSDDADQRSADYADQIIRRLRGLRGFKTGLDLDEATDPITVWAPFTSPMRTQSLSFNLRNLRNLRITLSA
jgi:hypothetical protein